jgi:hypothetical protein
LGNGELERIPVILKHPVDGCRNPRIVPLLIADITSVIIPLFSVTVGKQARWHAPISRAVLGLHFYDLKVERTVTNAKCPAINRSKEEYLWHQI